MPLRTTATVLLLGLSLAPTPVLGQDIKPEQVVGCYNLSLRDWEPTLADSMDSLFFLPPPRIALDTLPLDPFDAFPVNPAPGSRPSPHSHSSWWIEGDRIHARWSTGFVGVNIILAQADQALKGTARTFVDVRPATDYQALVNAEPVDCNSPPEYPISESQLVLREVPLVGSHVLGLGAQLPEAPDIYKETGPWDYEFPSGATGAFEGASRIQATVNREGFIREILVEFGPKTTVGALAAVLEAEMPLIETRRSSARSDLVVWMDWSTSITVMAFNGGTIALFRDLSLAHVPRQ